MGNAQLQVTTEQIEAAKRVDLIALAERYTQLHKESSKEHSGPCPKCGGNDRFHVKENSFFCRQCHQKWGDPIEFLRWMQPGLSFPETVAQLAGGTWPTVPATRAEPQRKAAPVQDPAWAIKAERLVEAAHERLWLPAGEAGRDYLRGRGLEAHVWLAYRLGYTSESETADRAPALVVPWYRQGKVAGVKFRYLEPQKGTRYKGLKGSQDSGLLYGGQVLESGGDAHKTLALCEGEFNAMSIYQASFLTRLDVLSIGAQSKTLSDAMIRHAQKYKHVLLWLDEPKLAAQVASKLPGSGAMNSLPSEHGRLDANDLLQRGLLGGILSTARLKMCKTRDDQEALLWNLWDAANAVQGVDGGTAQLIQRIGAELGKPVALYEAEPGRWITEGDHGH